jgi:hypothetical protein
MKRTILIAALVLCAFVFGGFTMQAAAPAAQQWEYKSAPAPMTDLELNLTGRAGWELVTVSSVPTDNGQRTLYVFKRPKQ